VQNGDTLYDPGTLTLTVSDASGNSATVRISLIRLDSKAPDITLAAEDYNILFGVTVGLDGTGLTLGGEKVATWSDDHSENCSVSIVMKTDKGTELTVTTGMSITEPGMLTLSVSDGFQNKSVAQIRLHSTLVFGLDALKQKKLMAGKEVDLLAGLSFPDGVSLDKVEFVLAGGKRTAVHDANHFVPDFP